MKSLYARYLNERAGDQIIEKEGGFVTYRYLNESQVYIIDIFVLPDERQKGYASKLADEVAAEAKAKGCKEMLGTVVPQAKNSTVSLKVLLGYGMSLDKAANDLIILKKEI